MTGGLIQSINIGAEDIFLTGSPQITFFKLVYRRHTNFATEILKQNFLSDIDFGEETTAIIEKLGDLMGRMYLEIDIPEIILKKNYFDKKEVLNDLHKNKTCIDELFRYINEYIDTNISSAKNILKMVSANNVDLLDVLKIIKSDTFKKPIEVTKKYLLDFIYLNEDIIKNFVDLGTLENLIDAAYIISHILGIISRSKNDILLVRLYIKNFIMNDYYLFLEELSNYVYKPRFELETFYNNLLDNKHDEYYKSAWVENLGNAIIDHISFMIGNQVIDKHTGDWLIIYYQLYDLIHQEHNYDIMIGNVPELTNFNAEPKKSYKLFVPLRFAFCRHTGLALPLISFKYHDVIFNLKLKNLEQVFYFEDDPQLGDINEVKSKYNINLINVNLCVEYIFLDNVERRRFASSSHEYLIETVQYAYFDKNTGPPVNLDLNFSNPIKYLVWFAQSSFNINNPTGTNKCQWDNYGICNKMGNPIETAGIKINSFDRIDTKFEGEYYNYLQPYWYFTRGPTDGINVYSFAIEPMLLQPSSTLNASRIDNLSLCLRLKKKFIEMIFGKKNGNTSDTIDKNKLADVELPATKSGDSLEESIEADIIIGVYAVGYNILRIFSGMGGLAFLNNTEN